MPLLVDWRFVEDGRRALIAGRPHASPYPTVAALISTIRHVRPFRFRDFAGSVAGRQERRARGVIRPYQSVAGLLVALFAAHTSLWAGEVTPQHRLAGQFLRAASAVIATEPLTIQALDGAVSLGQHAAQLDPDNPEVWRTLLQIATLAERGDLKSAALRRLVGLDSHDDVIRLQYINEAIENTHTIEERIEGYESLLSPDSRRKLGPIVASRLAADFALLLDRRGDVEGFGRWLAESVALDPSNRTAVAMATGFFRMNVADPLAEAELLTSLVLADPTDVNTQAVLGELLLEHGAYVGAVRLYDLAMRTHAAWGRPPPSGLLADRTVAQWGRGEAAEALVIIRERQRQVDDVYRFSLKQENPQLSPLDLAKRHAPLTSTLATVRAAIHNRLGDEQAGPTLRTAIAAYEFELAAVAARQDSDPTELAQRYLEAAWVALWLGKDTAGASSFLESAEQACREGGLSESARARFDGWIALRQGALESAVERLEPLANSDPTARLGLALAKLQQGRHRDAARGLLAVARSQPGTLMGVWAADVLAELLDQRIPPTEQATQLEQLIRTIPRVVDRFPDEPTLAVSVRVISTKTTFDPYEPIIVNLEITNHAPFPLAIDSGGPIRPLIALLPTAQISRAPKVRALPPMIVDIGRRLRLEPHERMIVPVNLRRSVLNQVLNSLALRGATLKVKAVINFTLTSSGVIRPGILGSQYTSQPIRVNGARVTSAWLTESIAAILEPDSPEDLQTMGLLSHVVVGQAQEIPDELRQQMTAAAEALAEAYPKLDAASQAWLVAVMPRAEELEPLLAMARKSEDRLVRIAYLLYGLTGLDDPMLDAAKRGSDPDVRRVAELMEFGLIREATRPDQ